MAMIRKRTASDGAVTWQAVVRVKNLPPVSKTFPSHDLAKRWARKLEVDLVEGKHLAADVARKHTLAEAIDRYRRDILPEKRTAASEANRLDWWRAKLGHLTLAELAPPLLAQCRDELTNTPYTRATPGSRRSKLDEGEAAKQYKRSPSTVRGYLATLGSVLTACVRQWHWLDDTPLRKIAKPRADNDRVRFLTLDERRALLKACNAKGPDLTDLVTLALGTGARAGELLGLRWPHINLKDARAWLGTTKNGHPRQLVLTGPALDVLKARAKVRNLKDDRVFPRLDGREPSDYGNPFREALASAGIKGFRFHDLRHMTASYLAMSGASTVEIAEVLGHRTLAVVKRYAHLSDAHRATVVKRGVDKLFEIEPPNAQADEQQEAAS